MFGYVGRILRVNLRDGSLRTVELDPELARRFIGGRGLAAWLLYSELTPDVDPLGPANLLVLATGPFAGSPIPGGSRFVLAARSPLTGLLGDTEIGGYFGHQLKRAGYDALVVEGRAQRPVYLAIGDGRAEIRDASHLWGQETADASRWIAQAEGRGTRVLAIGPAGERLVRYANVIGDCRYAGGRSGLGAVMGAKNLKAIAARGGATCPTARPQELAALCRGLAQALAENQSVQILGHYGTWNTTAPAQRNGILPTRNFQSGVFAQAGQIDGDAMLAALLRGRETCHACPIRCRRALKPAGGHPELARYGGPQYEAVAALGSLCLNGDPVAIARANAAGDAYGLDVISAGACIAFAMECVERGALTAAEVGFDLHWGDGQAVTRLVRLIGEREGIGDLLAEGVKRAAERIGRGSQAWALHVKGMELAMHDPRGKKGVGLSMATCHRGPDHLESFHDEAFERPNAFPELGLVEPLSRTQSAGKPRLVKVTQDYWGVLPDCLCICKFPLTPGRPLTPSLLLQMLNAVTGWDLSLPDLLLCGERVYNLCRLLNLRLGATRADDTLPQRLSDPLPEGASAGQTLGREELQAMLDEYYALRGWTPDGVPTPDTLRRLGLPPPSPPGGRGQG